MRGCGLHWEGRAVSVARPAIDRSLPDSGTSRSGDVPSGYNGAATRCSGYVEFFALTRDFSPEIPQESLPFLGGQIARQTRSGRSCARFPEKSCRLRSNVIFRPEASSKALLRTTRTACRCPRNCVDQQAPQPLMQAPADNNGARGRRQTMPSLIISLRSLAQQPDRCWTCPFPATCLAEAIAAGETWGETRGD